MFIDTMQQVYSNVTKVMIDSRAGMNLLNLPLDKLLQQSAAAATTVPGTPATPAAPAAAETSTAPVAGADIRSREAARTRDREGR
jgi:membrane protease subunit HflK